MRRIVTWLLSTVSALVLLFSYHTSTSSSMPVSAQAPTTPGTTGSSSDSGTGSGTDGGVRRRHRRRLGIGQRGHLHRGRRDDPLRGGPGADHRRRRVDHQVGRHPGAVDHRRDQEINSRAVPILNSEVLSAQSADIDMVGGATITSQAYIQSLQSAIDQAGL